MLFLRSPALASSSLTVLLFPIVWVEKRSAGQWRGTLQPANIDRWWNGYERFVLHYAHIAEAADAEWMSIGSELGSTETWRDRWFHLVGRLERVTSAQLLYSANWDHFDQVSFWPRIDAIGINGYFPLSRSDAASVKEMSATWRSKAKTVTAQAKRVDKPLVLTEVGYLSRNGGAVRPWDYTASGAIDLEEQRRAYAAFASAWAPLSTQLRGVIFWDWNGDGGLRDKGYTPRGKPAEAEARRFFRQRSQR